MLNKAEASMKFTHIPKCVEEMCWRLMGQLVSMSGGTLEIHKVLVLRRRG